MARHARQHSTTKIEFNFEGTEEQGARRFAQKNGGTAKQARLMGHVVWCAQFVGVTVVFLHAETGRRIGLCMYRHCPRKLSECGYHTGGRIRSVLPGQTSQQVA